MDISTFIRNELDEITAPLLTTEWGRRASMAALASSIVFLFGGIIEIGIGWRDTVKALSTTKATYAGPSNDAMRLVADLPTMHLFGQYGVLEKSTFLPITSLQLILTGIITAKPDSLSRVIISESGKPGKVYQVGDTLESGVRVYAIASDGVILENGGQLEKLPLRRLPSANKAISAKPAIPSAPALLDNNDEP